MISEVYIWTNGMVMVFDEHGEQMCALQGRLANVAEKISEQLTPSSKIRFAEWRGSELSNMDKDDFDRLWKKDPTVEKDANKAEPQETQK